MLYSSDDFTLTSAGLVWLTIVKQYNQSQIAGRDRNNHFDMELQHL